MLGNDVSTEEQPDLAVVGVQLNGMVCAAHDDLELELVATELCTSILKYGVRA